MPVVRAADTTATELHRARFTSYARHRHRRRHHPVPAEATLRLDNDSPEPARAVVSTTTGLEAVLADGTRLTPPWTR